MLDTRPFCSSVDHAYAQVTLMWCPHELAWTVMACSWVEAGHDDPGDYEQTYVRLGPFDDANDALRLAETALLERAPRIQR
jgi:hypothetical protein